MHWSVRLFTGLVAIAIALIAIGGTVLLFAWQELPDVSALATFQPKMPLRIYSADGEKIAEFGEERRVVVDLSVVPDHLIRAVLAAEDEHFYTHPGVDPFGILRAATANLLTGAKIQGGSTITMQVARNFYLSREKSYWRKLYEILLAVKLERELSKEQILTLYLNQIYLGQRAYGFAAAAQTYFGKPLQALTIAEAALLAGLPKAPSQLNPYRNREAALARREYVLRRMREAGFLDEAAYQTARQEPLSLAQEQRDGSAVTKIPWGGHVAEMARQFVVDQFGLEVALGSGLQVFTTVDSRLQRAAEAAVRRGLIAHDLRHGFRGPEGVIPAERITEMSDTALTEALDAYPDAPDALTAIVLTVTSHSILLWRYGERIELTGKALDFIRRALDPKAPAPLRLTPGAVVRIQRGSDGAWRLVQLPQTQGALVALDPVTGAVKALAGSFDFELAKFNYATQGLRQPGSAFKPFIYSAALERGWMPGSWVEDEPIVFGPEVTGSKEWAPKNYDDTYEGWMRLRQALAKSKNLPAVRVLHEVTPHYAQQWLTRFGLNPQNHPPYLTMVLGAGGTNPWEMARAYAVFANGGYLIEPYFIDEIRDAQGTLLWKAQPQRAGEESRRTIPERNAWLMDSLLKSVIEQGTGAPARAALKRNDLAGKTGTTNDSVDAWFAGYHPTLVAVSWIGYPQPKSLGKKETGARAALPIWIDFMREALAGIPEFKRPTPAGIAVTIVDGRPEYYYAELPPPESFPPGEGEMKEIPVNEDPEAPLDSPSPRPRPTPFPPILERSFLN
ncbi:MAG: PBP1A family penicillin-binding protein [Hydrogenophilus sp.]|nr:PBP1A family penicillin-binding protein [Hydrogenophilus sp.]